MRSKRLAWLFLALAALIMLAAATVSADGPVEYALTIAGTKVTSANAKDILGDGVFAYDPSNKKLTVSGDCKTNYPSVIESEIDGLTILATRMCTLRAGTEVESIAVSLKGDTVMTGVQIIAYGTYIGVYVADGAELTLDGFYLSASAKYGVTAECNETLRIKGSDSRIAVSGTECGAICDFKDILIEDGLLLVKPEGAINKNGCIYESDGTTKASRVVIDDEIEYGFYVRNWDVTSKNKDDIVGDGGTFRYDPETNTLFVSGDYEYNSTIIWNIKCPGLTIHVLSDSCLHNTDSGACIEATVDTYLTGNGRLLLDNDHNPAIKIGNEATLTIFDADVETSSGKYGIYNGSYVKNSAKLVVRNSDLTVNCGNPIVNLNAGIELVSCQIVEPSEYVISNGTIYGPDGETSPNKVVIQKDEEEQYMLAIQGKQVTSGNASDVLGDGVFSYDDAAKTLTVQGDCKTYTYAQTVISCLIDGLIINVTGDSVLQSESMTLEIFANTTLQGSGKLTLRSSDGAAISVGPDATLTIENANIDAEGETGFDGSKFAGSRLQIISSDVSVKGEQAAVVFPSGISLKDCMITSPAGAFIQNGSVMEAGGTTEAKEVTITNTGSFEPIVIQSASITAGLLMASVQNNTPYIVSCSLIAAYYDDSGRFIRSEIANGKSLFPGQTVVPLPFPSGSYVSSAARVMLLLCASDTMEPLADSYQVK